MIKLFKPFVSAKAKQYVLEVLNSDQLAEGEWTKRFEEAFAKKFNFKNVVAVNSGTSSLHLAYELAGVGPGDEVVTPVLSCTATNIPILHRRAIPVFADITPDLVIDSIDAEQRITSKTKAIVYVHFGGFGGGLTAIQELAKKHNLICIEDACQSVGSKDIWGTSDFSCVSLQAIKTLTSGDGGFLMCKDDNLHDKAKRLRWFGYDREEKQRLGDTDLVEAGYKYHLCNVLAAIGLGNLESIDELLTKRNLVREWYRQSGIPFLLYPWLVIFLHPDVKKVEDALAKEGIHISCHHHRNDKYSIFGGRRNDLPNMDFYEDKYTLMPFHYGITLDDVEKITSIINKCYVG